MIILLPTQQLDTMRPWDGLTVLLANFPLFGSGFAKIVNYLFLRHSGLLEWPTTSGTERNCARSSWAIASPRNWRNVFRLLTKSRKITLHKKANEKCDWEIW